MLDWVTISALATAIGTLVLAVATFSSVRSASRAARAAERALQLGLRPVLLSSRLEDPVQKVGFQDRKWLKVPGACANAEVGEDAVYLAISLRNAGNGLAVLHGWRFEAARPINHVKPELAEFHRLTRDLYVPAGEYGYWQGAFRDAGDPQFELAREAVKNREPMTVDVLYGDHDGGQRTISRFVMVPRDDDGWLVSHARQWNLDRPEPRD
ncbi:hypothetical protein [Kutzneria buriramensis]|uniref:Uncharacterized protein n=1 Tax=Kutzneria buriramensis TaxID=1045776 RepID=A0A3E0HYR3_9PSEU|nr:hypothetical protein [Kutzneria buriramensis]REH51618.1 hypothetical protein BCF44_10367 [Kutzneria buriramensis]